jgi:predicted P-loop ATPase
VAMWHKHHSPLMFVLAGFAQNTGKTHFFRYLLPNELQPYFAEAELTGDKDENLLMCNKLMIMNDEMSNKSKRDITMVKKLCSAQWFNLRRPYGRTSEDFRRIATLAGTSNDLALLNDPSGNRRIIPIDVLSIDHSAYNAVDKVNLWVEAYKAYKAGESFHLSSQDIKTLESNTEEFEEPSAESEGIIAYFEPGDSQYLTNTAIKSYIEIRMKQRLSAKKLGMELKRLGFEQVVRKVNAQPARVYGVREVSGVSVAKFLEDVAPF